MGEEIRVTQQEKHILPYKLEQHLVEVCNNTTYANLLSVWNINKKLKKRYTLLSVMELDGEAI